MNQRPTKRPQEVRLGPIGTMVLGPVLLAVGCGLISIFERSASSAA